MDICWWRPRRHLARLDELGDELQLELSQTITRMVGVLEKVLKPQGFNIGLNLGRAAGAGVPGHLHWHIVPRWIGDTNFMPAIAGRAHYPAVARSPVGPAGGGTGNRMTVSEWFHDE